MSSEQRGTALVTGGGRGIGAGIARALAEDGWSVVVAARSRGQIQSVAEEIGGRAVEVDVADQGSVERAVAEAGDVDLLVANAGISDGQGSTWELVARDWWHVLEVNVLGVHLCCRAVISGMLERASGRIVITASGSAYLPGIAGGTAYAASKAAVCRYGETLANELRGRIPVFFFSPGLVQTEMTSNFPDDAPWTPPELAPRLVVALASGRADALAGRYLHAEHDDIEDLIARADEIVEKDLNAIRLQR
jgi:3-oxoacyl-[acyl-carrier protein] reductase